MRCRVGDVRVGGEGDSDVVVGREVLGDHARNCCHQGIERQKE